MTNKKPDEEDLADWKVYINDVNPLSGDDKREYFFKKPLRVNREQIHRQRRREYYDIGRQPLHLGSFSDDTHKMMRISKVVIEARVDLHGLTKDQAQQQLQFFLMNAQIQGKSWVLVITGRGRPEINLTLQKLVPGWLDSLPYVSGYAPAKQNHGGAGALYVRLKKLRD